MIIAAFVTTIILIAVMFFYIGKQHFFEDTILRDSHELEHDVTEAIQDFRDANHIHRKESDEQIERLNVLLTQKVKEIESLKVRMEDVEQSISFIKGRS